MLKQKCRDTFWGLGSVESPIDEDKFSSFAKQFLGLSSEECLPGHRRFCVPLLDELVKDILVESECIPKNLNLKAQARPPCWKEYPGLCATREKWCWGEAVSLTHTLNGVLNIGKKGDFFKVRVSRPDGSAKVIVLVLCHVRLANPCVHILAKCKIDSTCDPPRVVVLSRNDGRLWCMTTCMLARGYLHGLNLFPEPRIKQVNVSELKVTFRGGHIDLVGEGPFKDVLAEPQLEPGKKVMTAPLLAWQKKLDDGLLELNRQLRKVCASVDFDVGEPDDNDLDSGEKDEFIFAEFAAGAAAEKPKADSGEDIGAHPKNESPHPLAYK